MEIQNNDRIKQLVVRYVKGELSEGEMDELERWRDERAEHEELFRNVVSIGERDSSFREDPRTARTGMEPDFKPDSTEETIFSENVVDALCSLVYFAFAGRRNRVSFMGYCTGNGAGDVFSPNCSRCIYRRVGIA